MNSKLLNGNKLVRNDFLKLFRILTTANPSLQYHSLAKRDNCHLLKLSCTGAEINDTSCKRNALRGGPGYTKYGHGRPNVYVSKFGKFWHLFLLSGIAFAAFFDFENFMFRGREPMTKIEEMKKIYDRAPKAKEITDESQATIDDDTAVQNTDDDDEQVSTELKDKVSKKKAKMTFRNRKIIEYENRIRQYSTPDKIFRYFATLKVWNEKLNDYEVFMTPEDFVRSLTYGAKQPEGLGLDSYNRFDPKMQKLQILLEDDCVFKRLNPDGIITFSDYVFLVTLLSTPTRHFEIAFYMFDLDGSGHIDLAEFDNLKTIIRNQTASGQRHRDTYMTGNYIKENLNLNEYFFGKNLDQLLTVDKFVAFQKQLQAEVNKMEFELCNLKEKEDGTKIMSEQTFCEMILAYAGFNSAKTKKLLKNIANIYTNETSKGITFNDYEDFFQVLRSIHDIDTALKFYSIAGASIDKNILKHVSKTVAGVNLSDHVVEVIFNLFDENGDGKLSHKEFIKVMKKRWMRGLQQPKDTGFVKFIEAVTSCASEMLL